MWWWVVPVLILAGAIGGAESRTSAPTTKLAFKPKPREVSNPKPETPPPLGPPSWWAPVGLPILLFAAIAVGVAAYLIDAGAWPFGQGDRLDLGTQTRSYQIELERTARTTRYAVASAAALSLVLGCCIRYGQKKRSAALDAARWGDYRRSLADWEEQQIEERRLDAQLEEMRREREAEHQRVMQAQRESESATRALQLVPPQPEPADPAFPEDCRALGRQVLTHAADDQRAAIRADDPQREAKLAAIERTYQEQLLLLARSDIHVDDRVSLHALKIRHEERQIPSDLEAQLFDYRKDLEYARLAHLAGVVADPLHREDERIALRRRLRRLEGSQYQARRRIAELEHKVLNADSLSPSLESPIETVAADPESESLSPEWQSRWREYKTTLTGENEFRTLALEKIELAVADYAASLQDDDPFRNEKIELRREEMCEQLNEFIREQYRGEITKEESDDHVQPFPTRQVR